MNRSPSYSAQIAFNVVNQLQYWSKHSGLVVRIFARMTNKVARPISRLLGTHHTVIAHLYGHFLVMPAEHPLAPNLQAFPQYNRPLGLAVSAIATSGAFDSRLAIIDVGANIGDTVAIIEQQQSDICSYLCIEADKDLAELCRLNHKNNSRVQIEQCFIGESEGSFVSLEDDGRANPSTKLAGKVPSGEESTYGQLVRLDTIAPSFAEIHGRIDLIKIDTEGYDFSVLRSGPVLLSKYTPSLYFEWFPRLLIGLKEEVWDGFEYLGNLGYRYFVFFTNRGDYYCKISDPDRSLLRSLASVIARGEQIEYFDVFASTSEEICNKLLELCISADSTAQC